MAYEGFSRLMTVVLHLHIKARELDTPWLPMPESRKPCTLDGHSKQGLQRLSGGGSGGRQLQQAVHSSGGGSGGKRQL